MSLLSAAWIEVRGIKPSSERLTLLSKGEEVHFRSHEERGGERILRVTKREMVGENLANGVVQVLRQPRPVSHFDKKWLHQW
jgi:hypothetical protein